MTDSDREVQKADPGLRKKVLVGAVFLVLALVAGMVVLENRFSELEKLAADSAYLASQQGLAAARVLLVAVALGAIVLGGVLGRLSWRTLSAARYPPPGVRVINDTPVLRGDQARRYGRGGLVLSAVLIAAGIWVPYRIHEVLDRLLQPGLKATPVSPADLGLE
ncbi:MAG: hypothetical protein V3T72_11905 [Thermoanaerobaculia bacterium]